MKRFLELTADNDDEPGYDVAERHDLLDRSSTNTTNDFSPTDRAVPDSNCCSMPRAPPHKSPAAC